MILGNILKTEKGGTQTVEANGKKVDDEVQDVIWGGYDVYRLFRMATFIDSTHMKL